MAFAVAGLLGFSACNDDDLRIGNPTMDLDSSQIDAFLGDSLAFTIKATDLEVPLSTLKAELFFGDEKVSQTVIRTKENDKEYTGKIYVPFFANIHDGTATLKYTLQNINFTTSEKETKVVLKRADYPYITLMTTDGNEYQLERTERYQYSATANFPKEIGRAHV